MLVLVIFSVFAAFWVRFLQGEYTAGNPLPSDEVPRRREGELGVPQAAGAHDVANKEHNPPAAGPRKKDGSRRLTQIKKIKRQSLTSVENQINYVQ